MAARRVKPPRPRLPALQYQQDPIRLSIARLGRKWTLLLLRDLAFLHLTRFSELLRNNPGLSPRVLSRRLREMEREGLLTRKSSRRSVEYALTPRGEDAVWILLALLRYGLRHYQGPQLPAGAVPARPPSPAHSAFM